MGLSKVFAVVALATVLTASVTRADDCLNDTSDAQRVRGTLTIEAKGSARPYILKLEKPICLTAADAADSIKSSRRVHIFSSDAKVHAGLGDKVGREITVTGRPFPAHTRYHHAPIVMDVKRID